MLAAASRQIPQPRICCSWPTRSLSASSALQAPFLRVGWTWRRHGLLVPSLLRYVTFGHTPTLLVSGTRSVVAQNKPLADILSTGAGIKVTPEKDPILPLRIQNQHFRVLSSLPWKHRWRFKPSWHYATDLCKDIVWTAHTSLVNLIPSFVFEQEMHNNMLVCIMRLELAQQKSHFD